MPDLPHIQKLREGGVRFRYMPWRTIEAVARNGEVAVFAQIHFENLEAAIEGGRAIAGLLNGEYQKKPPEWTCGCGYMNRGPICTHCGHLANVT